MAHDGDPRDSLGVVENSFVGGPMANPGADREGGVDSRAFWRRVKGVPDTTSSTDYARVRAWLQDIAQKPDGRMIERLTAESAGVRDLLAVFAGGSPYLWDLVQASPQRLAELLKDEPERRFQTILSEARSAISN